MPILGAYLKGSLAHANDFLFCGQEIQECPDQYSGPMPMTLNSFVMIAVRPLIVLVPVFDMG